jgi:hemolysin III
MDQIVLQNVKEERANALTHAFGVLCSGVSLLLLVDACLERGSVLELLSCFVFGTSLLLMYLSSTLYHAARCPNRKRALRIFDHSMIYVCISGSYTPVALIGLGGTWGWSLFIVVWVLTVLGLLFKIFFTGKMERLSLAIYLGMGWLAVAAAQPIWESIHPGGILWLVAGGLAYTVGTVFFALDRIRFFHAIWHLFVLTGSLCHVNAVLCYILPYAR